MYVDTGAMYRALTLAAIKKKVDLDDENAMVKLAKGIKIELKMGRASLQVFLNGEDVSRAIREHSITNNVRFVARISDVRKEMVKLQRKLAKRTKGAVLEGRDIGTVVFPNAKYKFYLDARIEERVRRRFKELKQMGQDVAREEVTGDISRRDRSDMSRKVAPLVKAADAVYIDTTNLTVNGVVGKILKDHFRNFSKKRQS